MKYLSWFEDRHGKFRARVRRKGYKTVYINAEPNTPEFEKAYYAALAGQPIEPGSRQTKPGSMRDLAARYFKSAEFRSLRPTTQSTYRNIINRFCDEQNRKGVRHGDLSAAKLQREHVVKLMAARAEKPDSANGLRKVLRVLMKHAIEIGWRKDDPMQNVKAVRVNSDGYHSWTDDEIEQFASHHPVGSKARLAFALLLYTGQRRSDVIHMGRQHVRDGMLSVRQAKTGADLSIPVHQDLKRVIDESESGHLTFLVTQLGKPFTAAGFGNWFRDQCDAAGLKNCSAHGLRKAAARRLAEAGCTANEIAAITGHASLREVTRYTKAADQKRLAMAAMSKVKSGTPNG